MAQVQLNQQGARDGVTSSASRFQGPGGARRQSPLILLVDDNADSLGLLQVFLSQHGWETAASESAISAWRWVQERAPDLIITDYLMPGATGLDLCAQIRSVPRLRGVPIIVHTASSLPYRRAELYDAWVPKPVDLPQLGRTVMTLLESRGAQTDGRTATSRGSSVERVGSSGVGLECVIDTTAVGARRGRGG